MYVIINLNFGVWAGEMTNCPPLGRNWTFCSRCSQYGASTSLLLVPKERRESSLSQRFPRNLSILLQLQRSNSVEWHLNMIMNDEKISRMKTPWAT